MVTANHGSRCHCNALCRNAAFGYFGHMWELYAFWAFVPVLLTAALAEQAGATQAPSDGTEAIAGWSFLIIAAGAPGCVIGGMVSLRRGSAAVARAMLVVSGLLCLASPLVISAAPLWLTLPALLLWGFAVVGDSPQFSTLVARAAPPESRGSALTIVNSIGFAITIGSIQLLNYLQTVIPTAFLFLPLTLGPAIGLLAMRRLPQPATD